jgi:transposase-like protein
MARREQVEILSNGSRRTRYFSEAFKRGKVGELDRKVITVGELSREYQVSRSAIYKWIDQYSLMRKKSVRMVVEADSDTRRIQELKARVAELERLVGQKQFEIDFLCRQMDIASEQFNVDFKKKPSGRPSTGSGQTGKPTFTK